MNVIELSCPFGAVDSLASTIGITNTVSCNAADALRGEVCAPRFALEQLATAHNPTVITQRAQVFAGINGLPTEKCIALSGNSSGT